MVGDDDKTPEEEEVDYCILARDQPNHMLNPWKDILVGDFVLVRINNEDDHVWQARGLIVVDRDETPPFRGQFIMQWWVSSAKARASKRSLYKDRWMKQWTKGLTLVEYIHCASLVHMKHDTKCNK